MKESKHQVLLSQCTHDESDDDVFTGKCDKAVLPAATSSLSFQDLITFAKQIALGMVCAACVYASENS